MKKSEILKKALKMQHHYGVDAAYICIDIKEIGRDDWESANCDQLIKWIDKSMKEAKNFTYLSRYGNAGIKERGVEAWLRYKGYIPEGGDMYEYRCLWLQDMINYWESKGE